MNAADLTKALGGRWQGRYGMARCPAHYDQTPSLKIEDGDTAPLLWCFARCGQDQVIDALRHRGLWPGRAERWEYTPLPKRKQDDSGARTEAALKIWRESRPVEGTHWPVRIHGVEYSILTLEFNERDVNTPHTYVIQNHCCAGRRG